MVNAVAERMETMVRDAMNELAATIDPTNELNDTTRTGYRIKSVLQVFMEGYNKLKEDKRPLLNSLFN